MIATSLLALALSATVVIENDSWPYTAADRWDTASLSVTGAGWFVECHMLTEFSTWVRTDWPDHWVEEGGHRTDTLEAGALWPGLPVGLYARVAGDLGGQSVQNEWHRVTGDQIRHVDQDPLTVEAGVWLHHVAGPITTDARLTPWRAALRVDAAWAADWAGIRWTGGPFARAWVDLPNDTAQAVHRQMGNLGLCGTAVIGGSVFSLSYSSEGLRGGFGWEF